MHNGIGSTVCMFMAQEYRFPNNLNSHYITLSSLTSLSNSCSSKQSLFIGSQLLLRDCRKAAELWSVCSPLPEVSICWLQMPSASTTRSLSPLRFRAGRVEIKCHSTYSRKTFGYSALRLFSVYAFLIAKHL